MKEHPERLINYSGISFNGHGMGYFVIVLPHGGWCFIVKPSVIRMAQRTKGKADFCFETLGDLPLLTAEATENFLCWMRENCGVSWVEGSSDWNTYLMNLCDQIQQEFPTERGA